MMLEGLTEEEARLITEDGVARWRQRERLDYVTRAQANQEIERLWAAFAEAFPQDAGWTRYEPEPLTHEQAQIEQIAASIWDTFHARHGGEFSSGGSIAADLTMALAERAWAIVKAPEPMTLTMMGVLRDDLNAHAHAGRWDVLSEAYGALEPTRMSEEEMVVYLRTLYMARDKITAYADLLARCRAALTRRGRNADRVLAGLDA